MTSHTLLSGTLQTLEGIGFYNIVLPFVLTFVIFYGILRKIELFGDKNNEISTVIAVILAFFVVNYVPVSQSLALFFSNLVGAWAVVLVVIVLMMTGAGLLGVKPDNLPGQGYFAWLVALAALFLAIYWGGVSMVAPGSLQGVEAFLSAQNALAVFVLLLGAGAVWYVAAGDEDGPDDSADDTTDDTTDD